MLRYIALGIIAATASALRAQVINVRGKVTTAAGQAANGALVELMGQGLKDTTGSDGMYSLTKGPISVRDADRLSGMSLEGNALRLRVGERARMALRISDVQGKVLWRESVPGAATGLYSWDLGDFAASGKMLVIQASIGRQTRIFRHRPAAGGATGPSRGISPPAPASARLAKVSAAVDTLRIAAAGSATKKVPIDSYDATVNVALDSAADIWGGLKNPPRKSVGCGKAAGVTSGEKTIQSGGQARKYTIDIPTGYDMNKPYRFFYCSHWIGARMQDVVGQNYYFLKPLATAAGEPAIFLAAQALPGNPGGTWSTNSNIDNNLFADILAYVKENLCIDESRVFTTGFSFGGMMTYSLSENRQKLIRAGIGIAPANYNIYVPPKTHEPIAWMQTTGMSDGTCPWVNNDSQRRGAKYIALDHAIDNGCAIPSGNNVPTWTSGNHVCYDFQGCKAGYPVRACTFGGGHTNIQSDPGSSANWIPQESWKFFSQF